MSAHERKQYGRLPHMRSMTDSPVICPGQNQNTDVLYSSSVKRCEYKGIFSCSIQLSVIFTMEQKWGTLQWKVLFDELSINSCFEAKLRGVSLGKDEISNPTLWCPRPPCIILLSLCTSCSHGQLWFWIFWAKNRREGKSSRKVPNESVPQASDGYASNLRQSKYQISYKYSIESHRSNQVWSDIRYESTSKHRICKPLQVTKKKITRPNDILKTHVSTMFPFVK
jgi:hypothetical protein